MSVLTDPTDAAFANATEALVPPRRALIPAFDTSEDSASYFQSMPASLDSGHQQVALVWLGENLQEVATPLAHKVIYADVTSEALSTSVQITTRPAWRPQLDAASTHEEIIAILRLFELDEIANRLGYLRQLVEDDPDEPSMAIESLRALAIFLMGERQLPDPRIGVTPDGLAQIEWRFPTNGILAMEFLSSGLIRFAAISAPAQRGVERLSVNGTLPKDAALEAVQPFTSRLSLL